MNDNELANLNDDSFDNLEIAGEFSITPVERSINLESSNFSKLIAVEIKYAKKPASTTKKAAKAQKA